MDSYTEEESIWFNPITFVFQFLANYGWFILGSVVAAGYLYKKSKPHIDAYRQAKEDAEYHKDPDKALARLEDIQRARERQQQLLLQASQKALEEQKEREERKRVENLERLKKYGTAAGGQKLGSVDDGYLPLSGGGSTSSYRPPKKSKCGGGGCGR